MTPRDIELVQKHFAKVYPVKAAMARTFYEELFRIAPSVRPLFADDMSPQMEKLADTLAFVVRHLHTPEHILTSVQGLARRHVKYGAEPAHFDAVGQALIFALHDTTDGGMAPELEQAWISAYGMIVDAMVPLMERPAA